MIKEEGKGSDVDEVSSSFGALKVDPEKGKAMYWGDSHWHLVLADVREKRDPVDNAVPCKCVADLPERLQLRAGKRVVAGGTDVPRLRGEGECGKKEEKRPAQ